MTFGEKLNLLRKKAGFTQDEIASRLGISPQAVSKWENDLSCPDIMLLPEIAKLYATTVDELLSCNDIQQDSAPQNEFIPVSDESGHTDTFIDNEKIKPAVNKNTGKVFLKVNILSQQGDKINVKLPLSLIKSLKGILSGIKLGNNEAGSVDFSEIDFDMIFQLVEQGVMGELVNIVSKNGDTIKVYAECE